MLHSDTNTVDNHQKDNPYKIHHDFIYHGKQLPAERGCEYRTIYQGVNAIIRVSQVSGNSAEAYPGDAALASDAGP